MIRAENPQRRGLGGREREIRTPETLSTQYCENCPELATYLAQEYESSPQDFCRLRFGRLQKTTALEFVRRLNYRLDSLVSRGAHEVRILSYFELSYEEHSLSGSLIMSSAGKQPSALSRRVEIQHESDKIKPSNPARNHIHRLSRQ
jgi:hypothetical protein